VVAPWARARALGGATGPAGITLVLAAAAIGLAAAAAFFAWRLAADVIEII
jgi:hypothetical protein